MRRGYKAWAEDIAIKQRTILHLLPHSPLPARSLAENLEITVVSPDQVPGMTTDILSLMLHVDPGSWSAVSFTRKDCTVIIHNKTHSLRRQESDLMHELAHILCGHEPSRLVQIDPSFPILRTFNPVQEEEANWLGGCLQLPRLALLWAVRRGMDNAAIERYFCASDDIVRFRRQITGVDRQLHGHK